MYKIEKLVYSLFDFVCLLYFRAFKKHVRVGSNVLFKGIPTILCLNGSKIIIGNNVKLDSRNKYYHLNMHSKTKLLADGKESEIIIGNNTKIHGTCIHAHKSIKIGNNCLIAGNTQIFDDSGHQLSMEDTSKRVFTKGNPKPILICDDVWIGTGVIIMPGTFIGRGSIISAGSVVTGIIPEKSIFSGNPAKLLKQY